MYEIMTADEAIRLIRDGDCICVNSFVGIENPIELHEAIYRRYQKMQSPTHLTMISSAGFGVWDDEHNAEGISEKDPELIESQLMIRWLSMWKWMGRNSFIINCQRLILH